MIGRVVVIDREARRSAIAIDGMIDVRRRDRSLEWDSRKCREGVY